MSLEWVSTRPDSTDYGRFVLATRAEYVVIVIRNSDKHFLESHSVDQGDHWEYYDTGVVAGGNNGSYDAITDADGVIHVLYIAASGSHLTEITRTAWQTWSSPVTVESTTYPEGYGNSISLARSSSGEIAVVWEDGSKLYGKKWTKANGWDASKTSFYGGNGYWCYIPRVAYTADGSAMVATLHYGSPNAYVLFAWGGATPTTLISNAYIIPNGMSLMMTGSTPHILWIQSSNGSTPWHVFLDTTQISSGAEHTPADLLLAQRKDGTQVLYYITQDDAAFGTVKRAVLTDGVAGTVAEYIPKSETRSSGILTCPSDLPNTEGLLTMTGGLSPYWVMVSHGIPIPPDDIVYSFPWVGRFQMCKVTV